ncbi:armadillo repeat-containing protein 4 armc4 [Anaeramoeba ignava]|uniref:Armadillo repeat-containing protein 4 armc4 n=1 Tax=Anaeramoeba ignava TaxID=1746090 RepID=A0A9Q0LDB9_ANAIG|nr:armadillo repeat-containing protein 4 armc4 [Anaeramoeba ignava]
MANKFIIIGIQNQFEMLMKKIKVLSINRANFSDMEIFQLIEETNGIELIDQSIRIFDDNMIIYNAGVSIFDLFTKTKKESKHKFFQLQEIPKMIQILEKYSRNRDLQLKILRFLQHLIYNSTENQDLFTEFQGIKKIIEILKNNPSDQILFRLFSIISFLDFSKFENYEQIKETDAFVLLQKYLKQISKVEYSEQLIMALRKLCSNSQIALEFINLDIINLVFSAINNFKKSPKIQQQCYSLLSKIIEQNLIDQMASKSIIKELINLMNHKSNGLFFPHNFFLLSLLSKNSKENQTTIRRLRGISRILDIINENKNNDQILCYGIEVLSYLVKGNTENQEFLRNQNAIASITNLAKRFSHNLKLSLFFLGFIENMCKGNSFNQNLIKNSNAIDLIISIMKNFSLEKKIQIQALKTISRIIDQNEQNMQYINITGVIDFIELIYEDFQNDSDFLESYQDFLETIQKFSTQKN